MLHTVWTFISILEEEGLQFPKARACCSPCSPSPSTTGVARCLSHPLLLPGLCTTIPLTLTLHHQCHALLTLHSRPPQFCSLTHSLAFPRGLALPPSESESMIPHLYEPSPSPGLGVTLVEAASKPGYTGWWEKGKWEAGVCPVPCKSRRGGVHSCGG